MSRSWPNAAHSVCQYSIRRPSSRALGWRARHRRNKWRTRSHVLPSTSAYTRLAGARAPPHATGVLSRAADKEQQAAWNLLSQLAVDMKTLIRVFPGETKSPCRSTQSFPPEAWVGDHLANSEARQYFDAVALSLRDTRLVAELPVCGRSRFRLALSAGIGRFLSSELSAEEALQNVAKQWSRIAADVGQQRVLNSYRISLGLLPQAD